MRSRSWMIFCYGGLLALLPFCCLATENKASGQAATLPNGRRLTPAGDILRLLPFPFTMALRPDGKEMVAPSVGWPFALNVVHLKTDGGIEKAKAPRHIPEGSKSEADVQVFGGVAYSPDGRHLYVATGDSGAIDIYATAGWRRVRRMPLDGASGGRKYTQSFAGPLALTPDGSRLYVLDQANWRVVLFNTRTQRVAGSAPTGINPSAIALSLDQSRLYVTNSGLFEYRQIQTLPGTEGSEDGLRFPPAGYPSRTAREGSIVGGYLVPGLGDENDPRGSSLWTYRLSSNSLRHTASLRLGEHISEQEHGAVGGASPTGIAVSGNCVFVSLSHEDAIGQITLDGTRITRLIPLSPFTDKDSRDAQGHLLRGISPAGMATHHGRLYVAESGINAVAVIDTDLGEVLGHIPSEWYPVDLRLSRDGRTLYTLTNKGIGSGPNWLGGERVYIGQLERGSLSAMPLADLDAALPEYTRRVIESNLAPTLIGSRLPHTAIDHIFLIIRENRTFDEVMGDLTVADGDAGLARYGMHATLAPGVRDVPVTPNAHALAQQFATSDRFSTDSDVSADGHRWAVGIAPTEWMNQAWTGNYGGRRTTDMHSAAPGRRALGGGNDAPMPEDEPEFGSMWEHVADAGLAVLNYGEGLELEGSDERAGVEPEGQRLYLNSPLPKPVFSATDRAFPTFNLGIPDQVRFEEFAKDFQKHLNQGQAPALTVIRLPGDHTALPRPGDGYRYKASYVADNDLALGRIVDLISHGPLWRSSAIFVIEDDAQDGVDHFDAHRSVVLAISPFAKRGYISHVRTSTTGVQKTIFGLIGLGPLNLEDRLAAGLGDMFTDTPDYRPYTYVPSDTRVFDPKQAKTARPQSAGEASDLLDADDARKISSSFGVGEPHN